MSRDAGALTDLPREYLARLGAQTTPVRLAIGGSIGALLGHFIGKHALIGATIGAIGGYATGK